MKPPVKALLIALAVIIGLPMIAWTGTFLYWHMTIKSALRSLEARVVDQRSATTGSTGRGFSSPPERAMVMAGCRALPYLVTALDGAEDGDVYEEYMDFVIQALVIPLASDRDGMRAYELAAEEYQNRWTATTSTKEWKGRRKNFMAWWREEGLRRHQWWRVWSGRCR